MRLVKVEKKDGTGKNGKVFTKFTITDSRAVKYGTFDKKLETLAAQCIEARTPVQLTYEETQYGNDLKEIKVWQAPAAAPVADAPGTATAAAAPAATGEAQPGLPVDREPGEEG